MKKYLIYACDAMYGSNGGTYDWNVMYCKNENEAQEIGRHMSEEVIESYEYITESIDEEVRERLSEEGVTCNDLDYEELYDDWYEDVLNEHIEYEYWELDPSINYDEIINQDTNWEELRDKYSINKGE